jgi:hypothetical protein
VQRSNVEENENIPFLNSFSRLHMLASSSRGIFKQIFAPTVKVCTFGKIGALLELSHSYS